VTVGLNVVVPASILPVTLAAAKAHVRADSDDDDALLSGMIAGATGYAERFLGRALVEQTFNLTLDAFPTGGRPIVVPRPPLIEVLGIFVLDADDVEEELTGFRVDTAQHPGRIFPPAANWPTGTRPAGIRIAYRAGYIRMEGSPPAAVGDIPADIHAALLLYVGSLYLQRETLVAGGMAEVPWSAEQLLRNHRVEIGLA
jgi:uncharacterized phiE125 gp8 family phage protein